MKNIFGEGCSAFTYETKDEKHLFARNFDYNRLATGSKIIYVPNGYNYALIGSEFEHNLENEVKSKYKVLGIGNTSIKPTPAFYDGVNECGLAGSQLYYRNFAKYSPMVRPNTQGIQAPFVIYHLLASCKDLIEVVDMVERKLTIIDKPLFGSVATLHFIFTDTTGKSIVIECNDKGVNIYKDALGILTNSPSYDYQVTNLMNYANLRVRDYDDTKFGNLVHKQAFSGNGLIGLPGDFSSISRFVRLAFFKEYAIKAKDEAEGVMYLSRIMNNVAFPLGLVEVTNEADHTMLDKDILPYDYTIYTVIFALESQKLFYYTYCNTSISYISLSDFVKENDIVEIELEFEPQFNKLRVNTKE